MKTLFKKFMHKLGYRIERVRPYLDHFDMDDEFCRLYEVCKPFTLTSKERMFSLYKALEYIVSAKIPGDIVEAGVWRGGSSMMAAMALVKFGDTSRKLWLYDTYQGMVKPTDKDVDMPNGLSASDLWQRQHQDAQGWYAASLEEVQANMESTRYPLENMRYIKGKVEETIPAMIPENVALLRLDTDWYESTYHELVNLYPLISQRGVIIIDDYGWWRGAREAVDTYLSKNEITMLLNRIDETGRIGLKIE